MCVHAGRLHRLGEDDLRSGISAGLATPLQYCRTRWWPTSSMLTLKPVYWQFIWLSVCPFPLQDAMVAYIQRHPGNTLSACSTMLPSFPFPLQEVMVAYFQRRPGRLSQEGLAGLRASMAGIYYVPLVTGVSMHFRFAGQSIPNRCGPALLWLRKCHACVWRACLHAPLLCWAGVLIIQHHSGCGCAGRRCGGSTGSKFTWT